MIILGRMITDHSIKMVFSMTQTENIFSMTQTEKSERLIFLYEQTEKKSISLKNQYQFSKSIFYENN